MRDKYVPLGAGVDVTLRVYAVPAPFPETKPCEGCAIEGIFGNCNGFLCSAEGREDGQNVVFSFAPGIATNGEIRLHTKWVGAGEPCPPRVDPPEGVFVRHTESGRLFKCVSDEEKPKDGSSCRHCAFCVRTSKQYPLTGLCLMVECDDHSREDGKGVFFKEAEQ